MVSFMDHVTEFDLVLRKLLKCLGYEMKFPQSFHNSFVET